MSSLSRYYVIALDFGYAKHPRGRTTIEDLGDYVYYHYRHAQDAIILAQECTFFYLLSIDFPPERLRLIDVGQSSANGTEGGGTYHVLQEAHDMIHQLEYIARYSKPIHLVAHQAHTKRAIRQGQISNLQLHPRPGLPSRFYRAADQWWCRNCLFWHIREVVGYLPLKLSHQL